MAPATRRPKRPIKWWRVAVAFATAPLMPVAAVSLTLLLGGTVTGDQHAQSVALAVPLTLLFTVPATYVVGLPGFLLLRWLRWEFWYAALAVGALVGPLGYLLFYVPTLVYATLHADDPATKDAIIEFLPQILSVFSTPVGMSFIGYGAATALAVWQIIYLGVPSTAADQPNTGTR